MHNFAELSLRCHSFPLPFHLFLDYTLNWQQSWTLMAHYRQGGSLDAAHGRNEGVKTWSMCGNYTKHLPALLYCKQVFIKGWKNWRWRQKVVPEPRTNTARELLNLMSSRCNVNFPPRFLRSFSCACLVLCHGPEATQAANMITNSRQMVE